MGTKITCSSEHPFYCGIVDLLLISITIKSVISTQKGRLLLFRLIKNEFVKLRGPVILTIVILSLVAIVLSSTMYQNYMIDYGLEAWEIGVEILNFLFPLFVVVPICWLMYYERKDKFLLYTLPRVSKRKYLSAKWIVAAISAFAIIFVPYFLSAVFILYIKQPVIPELVRSPEVSPFAHVYLDMFVNKPLLYAFLLSLWKGIIGVLVMNLGFVLSLYVKNIFIVLTGPFIYVILENFVLSILGLEKYRLVTSFEPTTIADSGISAVSPLVGPILLVIVTVIVWYVLSKVNHKTVYEV